MPALGRTPGLMLLSLTLPSPKTVPTFQHGVPHAQELPEFVGAQSGACVSTRTLGYCWNKHHSADPS